MTSKRRIRKIACKGKVIYHSFAEAVRVLDRRVEDLNAYRCPVGGGPNQPHHWHIGHRPSKVGDRGVGQLAQRKWRPS